MRLFNLMTFSMAFVLASLAGILALNWLEGQRQIEQPVAVKQPMKSKTIVVAVNRMGFGTELSTTNLREIEWHAEQLPEGAFDKVSNILKAGERRVAISPIEPNEPILRWKITGPGQRATLSALLGPDMKAVTVRVNDVNGIAGFVLPGDRVDLLITRRETNDSKYYTEVLLQDVRVLGVDQLADERSEKPAVAKSITIEVKITDAQKVVLASAVGSLSLALRGAGSAQLSQTSRITPSDLSVRPIVASSQGGSQRTAITVTRGLQRQEYSVLGRGHQTAGSRQVVRALPRKKNSLIRRSARSGTRPQSFEPDHTFARRTGWLDRWASMPYTAQLSTDRAASQASDHEFRGHILP